MTTPFKLSPPREPLVPLTSGLTLWTWAAKTPAEIEADIRAFDAITDMLMAPYFDNREDECWRMFGIIVDYTMDERVVTCG